VLHSYASLSRVALSSPSLLHVPLCHCFIYSSILKFTFLVGIFYAIDSRFRFVFECYWFTFSVLVWVSLVHSHRYVVFSPIFFCSHYLCSFIHSIFAFIGFGRFYLGPFAFTDFTRCLQEVCFLIFDMLYYLYACTAFCMLV